MGNNMLAKNQTIAECSKIKQNKKDGRANNKLKEENVLPAQKSVIVTYLLWMIGGIFGLHHLYLNRDRHAFIWWCSLGGYSIGWIWDAFLIPGYVQDANEDPRFISGFVAKMRTHQTPPQSAIRIMGEVMFGYLFGQLCMSAIPQTITLGLDFTWLHWCIPLFVSLGVWTVGNVGRECGVWWQCFVGALAVYPARYFIYDETYTLLATAAVSALVFDGYSKQWLRTPPQRRSHSERCVKLSGAVCIYLSLWGCVIYFNGTITDEYGGEVPIHEALQNFLASAWWNDMKQAIADTWQYAQHHGWRNIWLEIYESLDVDGERNAYKVLGISATASQSDITAAYRKMSKEHHPDKVKDEALRAAAHQRFIEIQQAYNVLSKIKSSRRRKNHQFNDGETIVV